MSEFRREGEREMKIWQIGLAIAVAALLITLPLWLGPKSERSAAQAQAVVLDQCKCSKPYRDDAGWMLLNCQCGELDCAVLMATGSASIDCR